MFSARGVLSNVQIFPGHVKSRCS